MTGSLGYRKNEAAILRGDVPEKYLRILPHVPGDRVLEIGSAEGVLALMLARQGKRVTALEMREDRAAAALRLSERWALSYSFQEPTFVVGRIDDRLDLLAGIETLVAVRMIYYLRAALDVVFSAVSRSVPNVVLCGNRNRAERFHSGTLTADDALGEMNFYAGADGMTELLKRHGYRTERKVTDGDAIVVGRKDV
jgi:choline dehydrogenase-like flavoprotein